ncbi:sugar ABC transporter ATP-binding protein [Pueribacillus theae]|uniref:Sugar ABC transporter ATP-binding protein n=1 Tax=Pueribacillus theae TaxID=2171751 RepID=A0A2U1K6B7_9BACI|nr:sugar ABC transporter ATP-binding protein [Pueribacillus theae]PWA13067.1 sugar ABC transporter ATP-binding protein [Pueribacillus theae]
MNGAILEKNNTSKDIAINISGLTKKYGNFYAVSNVDITISKGEIHSLVGQNGAGKSTLLGILSGRVTPSSGCIKIFGEELNYGDPRSSRRLGIATIYQELTIIPNLTAVDNVFLGQNISRNGFLSKRKMQQRFNELSELLGVNIPPSALSSRLSIADQQMLEIMRGIQLDANILILDEPTASLAPAERESLLKTIKSLREKGITIIYVSHHLDEVLEISDSVTILRNGEKIKTERGHFWTKDKLVAEMLGKEIGNDLIQVISEPFDNQNLFGKEVLRTRNVVVPGAVKDISFSIRSGEIIGIGGLVGSGRSTFVRALAGLEPTSTGELWIDSKKVKWPSSPRYSMNLGIALAPEDRKHQGLVLDLSCQDNINMVDFKRVRRWGLYHTNSAKNIATVFSKKFGLNRPIQTLCRNLSGGNQQKVLLSKVCNLNPRVLIVDEPTRGIDIGVKIEVLKILKQLASEGMSIIVISSELEEVVAVSDRVLVFSKGRLVKELNEKHEINVGNILRANFLGGTT